MTTTSLRTVTLETVANYRHAAERTLRAYRSGGQRLITMVRNSVDRAAERGAEPYVPALAAVLRRAGDNLGQLAHQGLETVSERTSRAIGIGADGVSSGVKRVADFAGGVDNKVVAGGLNAAVRISLPGAQVALALSERLASGADKLADVAGGAQAKQAVKAAGKRIRRAKAEATEVVADAVNKAANSAKTAKTAKTVKPAKVAKSPKAAKAAVTPSVAKPRAKPRAKQALAESTKPAPRARRRAAAVVQTAQDTVAAVAL